MSRAKAPKQSERRRVAAATRDRDREIYRSWIGGQTQTELAKAYKIGQQRISSIVRATDRETLKELAADVAPYKARVLARLEYIYQVAIKSGELGDALKACSQIVDLLGLKAPTQVDIRGEVEVANEHFHQHQHVHIELTEEERKAHIRAIRLEIEREQTGSHDAESNGKAEQVNGRGTVAPKSDQSAQSDGA